MGARQISLRTPAVRTVLYGRDLLTFAAYSSRAVRVCFGKRFNIRFRFAARA